MIIELIINVVADLFVLVVVPVTAVIIGVKVLNWIVKKW